MNRRAFISRVLGAVAAGAVLDVDKLLWVPGAKSIFVPSEAPFLLPRLQIGDMFTIAGIEQKFVVGCDDFSDHRLTRFRRDPSVKLHGNLLGQILSGQQPNYVSRLNV